MQLVTRNEVPAVVHRVVAVTNGNARLSCPVLLRARSGMKMDISKYLGKSEIAAPLLQECDGMLMQDIHDKMQSPLRNVTSNSTLLPNCKTTDVVMHLIKTSSRCDDPDSPSSLENFESTPDYYYLYDQDKAVTTYRWSKSLVPYMFKQPIK